MIMSAPGTTMHGCRACDYDLCPSCAAGSIEGLYDQGMSEEEDQGDASTATATGTGTGAAFQHEIGQLRLQLKATNAALQDRKSSGAALNREHKHAVADVQRQIELLKRTRQGLQRQHQQRAQQHKQQVEQLKQTRKGLQAQLAAARHARDRRTAGSRDADPADADQQVEHGTSVNSTSIDIDSNGDSGSGGSGGAVVHAAWYGDPADPWGAAHGRGADVTDRIRDLLAGDRDHHQDQAAIAITATNGLFGDPVPNTPKVLLVRYTYSGASSDAELQQASFSEHSDEAFVVSSVAAVAAPTPSVPPTDAAKPTPVAAAAATAPTGDTTTTGTGTGTSTNEPVAMDEPAVAHRWATQLACLADMGFYDQAQLAALLDETRGDVQRVMDRLLA
jgi:hypothetical protein